MVRYLALAPFMPAPGAIYECPLGLNDLVDYDSDVDAPDGVCT